ncbi:hypothetical protein NAV33_03140 [Pseudomonas stutzeri]|uniref:hypothetical protein n=1 Tax=Stutzerimonas stutzeri TaxID=316 RepID=UPI00210B8F37|nr:hypothetical protein [Stutzerimonas stutzeri]MCQ4310896.1 hypothetical protein [Stutzerimonas stutzeri]
MIFLIIFLAVWFVVALFAKRRRLSATIAIGGGFITAVIATSVVSGGYLLTERYAKYQSTAFEKQRGGALSKSKLLAELGEFAPVLKAAPADKGELRELGKTQGGSTGILEISGTSDVVEKATLAFSADLNDEQIRARNLEMATRYVHALFPEWNSPEAWLAGLADAGTETQVIEREGRRLIAKHSNELSLWFLTVEKL